LTIAAAATMALALVATPATAQAPYPDKPVRIIAPFAPGGLADVLARAIGERLAASLGQPFVVENRAGAGGNIGADVVAKAAPDGYTLLLSSAGILTINGSLYEKMPFDPATAFAPVTILADMPMLLVVRGDAPMKSVGDLIGAAQKEPGRIFFGSPGNGTTGHLGLESFKHAAKIDIAHVPYKSAAEAVTAAIGGQTTGMFDNPPTVMAQIRAGGLRALGVAAKARMPQLPDVPTIDESGLKGFEASSWFALVAPAKTPAAIIERLHAATVDALQTPEMQRRFTTTGARLVGNRPEAFAQQIVAERAQWDRIIKGAGIRVQ